MIGSVDDFINRLSEIDILISYAKANQRAIAKYKLFNKTAMVLLCSHFEVFVESFISEHVDAMRLSYKSDAMPQYMKDNYINDTFKMLKDSPTPSRNQKPLKALFKLHDSTPSEMVNIADLELDTKYSFGKHGQGETQRLFNKFGFGAFVDSTGFKDPFKKINSAISIRNNIIHEGSAPMLNHGDVNSYKKEFVNFAKELEKHVLSNQVEYYGKVYYV